MQVYILFIYGAAAAAVHARRCTVKYIRYTRLPSFIAHYYLRYNAMAVWCCIIYYVVLHVFRTVLMSYATFFFFPFLVFLQRSDLPTVLLLPVPCKLSDNFSRVCSLIRAIMQRWIFQQDYITLICAC